MGDPNETRFTATQVNDALDRANEMFALETGALFKDSSTTVSGGDVTEDLPTDFMYEIRVSLDGLKMDAISRDTLEQIKRGDNWKDDEGEPSHYIIDPEEAEKKIRLYPTLPSGESDRTMVLTYFPIPAAMTSDSDTPLNGYALLAQFHIAIAAMAAWILLNFDDTTEAIEAKKRSMIAIYDRKSDEARDTVANTVSEQWSFRGGRNTAR